MNAVAWKRRGMDFLAAAALLIVTTAFKLLLPAAINRQAPFVLYLTNVVLCTLLRGSLCGILCVVGTMVTYWHYFLPIDLTPSENLWLLLLRILEWLWIVGLCARARHSFLVQQKVLQSRDQLFALASHELRNPLQGITLGLQLMKPEHPDQVLQTRNILDRQVKKLTLLVDDLLDTARIHAGKLSLHREHLDLCPVVQDIVERFHCPQIEFQRPAEIWGWWDRMRIDHILTNLLSNAIKYGRGKPIRVQVLGGSHHARLIVQDQGVGMTREQLARAFIPFDRLGAENSPYPGCGLGLWIVHEIVQSKGGKISLFSEPKVGTTVVVELPLQPFERSKSLLFLERLRTSQTVLG